MRKRTQIIFILLQAPLIILLDQVSKRIALQYFPQSIYRNEGIAFSLPLPQLLLYLLVFIVLIALLYNFRRGIKQKDPIILEALTLVIAGAFSNLLDRLFKGHVIDFINLPLWSVLNLADLAIFTGIIILVIREFRKK